MDTGSFAKSHNPKMWSRFSGIIFLLFQSFTWNHNKQRRGFNYIFYHRKTNKQTNIFCPKALMPLTSNLLVLFQKSLLSFDRQWESESSVDCPCRSRSRGLWRWLSPSLDPRPLAQLLVSPDPAPELSHNNTQCPTQWSRLWATQRGAV